MTGTVLFGTAAVPTILGLVQLAKTTGLPARFAPLLALLLGLTAGASQLLVLAISGQAVLTQIAEGIALGLAASGLYSGAQTILPDAPNPIHVQEGAASAQKGAVSAEK